MVDFRFGEVWHSLPFLLDGAKTTVLLAVASMALALSIGIATTAIAKYGPSWAGRSAVGIVDFFRGIPLFVLILFLYYLPAGLDLPIPATVSGVSGLSLYYGSYIAEIIRGSLRSVPAGHLEASASLGLREAWAFRRIILPQALATVISPIAGQFARLLKGTSLLSVISIGELTLEGRFIMARTYASVETWIVIAGIYLVMNTALMGIAHWLERRMTVWRR